MKRLFCIIVTLISSMLYCHQFPNNQTPLKYEVVKEKFSPNIQFLSEQFGFYHDASGAREIFYDKRQQHETSRDDVTLRIHFVGNTSAPVFLIMNDEYFIHSSECDWISYYLVDVTLPAGDYDMYTIFELEGVFHFVIQEINTLTASNQNFHHRNIYVDDASNQIELLGIDPYGQPFNNQDRYFGAFIYYLPEKDFSFSFSTNLNYMFVSEFNETMELYTNELNYIENEAYLTNNGPYFNLEPQMVISNQPSDFASQQIEILIPIERDDSAILFNYLYWFQYNGIVYNRWPIDIFDPEGSVWNYSIFLMEHILDPVGYTLSFSHAIEDDVWTYFSLLNTPPFHCREGKIGGFWNVPPTDFDYLSEDGATLQYGNYPSYINSSYFLQDNLFYYNPWIFGYNCEDFNANYYNTDCQLYNSDNQLIFEGNMLSIMGLPIAPDAYRLEIIDENLEIAGLAGFGHLTTCFDVSNEYSNPPSLTHMKICDASGIPNHQLSCGESASLLFAGADFEWSEENVVYQPIQTNSAFVAFKLHENTEWIPLNVEFVDEIPILNWSTGKFFSADLSQLTQIDSVAYDLQFYFEDADGNSCRWTLSPAFVVGDFNAVESDEILPQSSSILSNYPNPFNPSTTISFALSTSLRPDFFGTTPRQAEIAEGTELVIYNIKGQKVRTLDCSNSFAANARDSRSTYSVVWNGDDDNGKPVSSGIYFARLKAGEIEKNRKMLLLK